MGVESINNNTPPILNSLNDSTSNEMSRPSNCVNRPKNKVRNQAIIVNIIIHINRRSVLLIIKLTRDTGIVKIFRSEEHTSELQSRGQLVCRLLLEKKKKKNSSSLYNYSYPVLPSRPPAAYSFPYTTLFRSPVMRCPDHQTALTGLRTK